MKCRGKRTMLVSPEILVEMFKALHAGPIYESATGLPKDVRLERTERLKWSDNIVLILSSEKWKPEAPYSVSGIPPEVVVMFQRDGWKPKAFEVVGAA